MFHSLKWTRTVMKYGSEWEGERGPRYGWKGLKGPPAGPAFVLADTFTPAGHKGFGDTSRIHSPHLSSPSQSCLALLALLYSALRFVCPRSVVLCVITIMSRLLLLIFWGYGFVYSKTIVCVWFWSSSLRKFKFRFCLFRNVFVCFVKVLAFIFVVIL